MYMSFGTYFIRNYTDPDLNGAVTEQNCINRVALLERCYFYNIMFL